MLVLPVLSRKKTNGLLVDVTVDVCGDEFLVVSAVVGFVGVSVVLEGAATIKALGIRTTTKFI